MKKLIITALIGIVSVGCTKHERENKLVINWIYTHEKPIKCIQSGDYVGNFREYTLIDNKGKIYITGYTELALPDTLLK